MESAYYFVLSGEIAVTITEKGRFYMKIIGKNTHIGGTNRVLASNSSQTGMCKSDCTVGKIPSLIVENIYDESKMKAEEFAFYKNIPIFKDFSQLYLDKLFRIAVKFRLKRGESLLKQGEAINSIFLVRKGEIEVSYNKKQVFENEYRSPFLGTNIRCTTRNRFQFQQSYTEESVFKVKF